jgi:hypothetical protein
MQSFYFLMNAVVSQAQAQNPERDEGKGCLHTSLLHIAKSGFIV